MAETLSVGIDLGCDTLKLSYAYRRGGKEGGLAYGKLENTESVRHVAIPAVAYYDAQKGWIFGSDVEKGGEKPFITVVKIKSLLSLLYPSFKGGKIEKRDGKEVYPQKDFYYDGEYFPKFFFPTAQRDLKNFKQTVASELAFKADGYTPQKVCKLFFAYAREIALKGIGQVEKKARKHFDEVRLSIVHRSQTGDLYVNELTSLVKTAFGMTPYKVMNSGRALSMFARERGAVKNDDEILIFDMGEDTLSVQKCFINDDGNVVVEPAADHSAPVDIGGNDVDFSIADYIERSILRRETVGSPSFGEDGHIHEEGLQSKQYLFLKEIKKAKLLLSVPSLGKIFGKGVPVSLHRDLYLQLSLTKEDLMKGVGITGDGGIARKILDYIIKEINLPLNGEVKNVFLTGGLIETYGLLDYIKEGVRKVRPTMVVRTFEDNFDNGDPTVIQTYEDSVYAPSVGAAIVALRNLEVGSGLAYSYGTWMSINGVKILQILVGRGHVIDESASERLSATCGLDGTVKEEFFQVRLSKGTIARRKYEGEVRYLTSGGQSYLCIGEPDSYERKKVEERFQLKTISGTDARILCSYRGKEIRKCDPKIEMREGVVTTPFSTVMTPFVEKGGNSARRIRVTYRDGTSGTVSEKSIEIKLTGVREIIGENT